MKHALLAENARTQHKAFNRLSTATQQYTPSHQPPVEREQNYEIDSIDVNTEAQENLMLLLFMIELVLGLNSHLDRIFEFICTNKNHRNQLLRAPSSVGSHNSMRVDEGIAGPAIKLKARTVVGRGEKSLLRGHGSELRLRGEN